MTSSSRMRSPARRSGVWRPGTARIRCRTLLLHKMALRLSLAPRCKPYCCLFPLPVPVQALMTPLSHLSHIACIPAL
jgi:hypothetical protein